ncbi:MAG: hypothetical protein COU47_02870 [Candidatus Niyogibacteria bacterium CG10_big_fil_rev_8_21_14_0_10_46_36]|uniref:Uncharacterized protein n=1 Tax=Candidatus Niyogibacteria bacterium CG10_big_fil_rev_8_21_14_0_10_46_36 TaxID=1974726 RepID=A0A2H0TD70_9BACT|nr:MAG: hypothetical protein COU47_02870 [Candidatus Niyogibacteria bacterium CG10_big_fil_rev_8_21_14_0_10_46_36]
MKGRDLGVRVSDATVSRGDLEEGQLYICHEEQEGGPMPYFEIYEDGVLVMMGYPLFIPFA